MAEEKSADKGEAKEEGKAKQKQAAPVVGMAKKEEKQPWTLKRCLKIARRFESEQDWAKNKPSSYKAAQAHGWMDDCLAAQNQSSHSSPQAA